MFLPSQSGPGVTSTKVHMETGSCTGAGSQQGGQDMFKVPTSAFSTTETFTATHGFVICTQPAAAAGQQSRSSSSCSTTSSSGGAVAVVVNNAQRTEQQQQQQATTPVGWSGLLEISRSGGGPGLVGAAGSGEYDLDGHIEVACTAHASTGVRRLVKSVVRGLKARQDPEAAREGMGGTYFLTNEAGRKVAIFKPCDEEPLAPANPKGYLGRNLGDPGWKSTVRVGEAAMREVAAYLLDHDHYAQVPHTVLVRARHPVFNYKYAPTSAGGPANMGVRSGSTSSMASVTAAADAPAGPRDSSSSGDVGGGSSSQDRLLKLGSLQEFVYHIADTSDFGASRFRTRDVHAIGILDIRLFNTDRHAGNILVRQPQASSGSCRDLSVFAAGSRTLGMRPPSLINAAAAAVASSEYELIPIDHGFCLPEALEAPFFEWLHWPQACLPFSEEELQYIARLDAAADIALLQQELPNLRPECLRVLEVSTNFLQRCAAAGLSLADIGALASRPLDALDNDDSCPSELEKACIAARQAVETRELTASMHLSDDYSSDTLREVDEEDEDSSSSDHEEASDEQQHSMAGSPMVLGSQQQQQQQLLRPSRLGLMAGANGTQQQQQEGVGQPGLDGAAAGGKAESSRQVSGLSEGTACNLATAMSLGKQGVDGDLLFDLDDDSGSSAANTPLGSDSHCARGSSPLGRRLPAAAGTATGPAAAGGAVAAGDEDVVMAAASSWRQAESLSQYLTTVQLQPPAPSAFTAAAAAGPPSGDGNAAAAPLPPGSDSGSGSLCSPLGHAMSTPVGANVSIARSMQVGNDGWAFRDAFKSQAGLATVGRMNVKKQSAAARRRTGMNHTMYPPPVIRAPPRSTNEVLSGLSQQQWQAFMCELLAYMDDALRPGQGWRGASQAAGIGTVAMSCPRF